MSRGVRDTLSEWQLVLRCSSIGALLGAVPGVGVSVLDWIAYGHAARRPGAGPKFGDGNVRGVIAPESANNAKEGGSLIPTIAFGVPGSASMSVLLGAFVIHGLVPGPDMLGKNASITISMVFTIAIANILGAFICLFLTRPLSAVARAPAGVIVPVVVAFIVIGSFQTSTSTLDFVVLILLGFVGMAMKELNWPRAAFALGFVLGPIMERYFFLAYQISGWSWLTRPFVLILLGMAVVTVLRQMMTRFRAGEGPSVLAPSLADVAMGLGVTVLAAAAFASAIRFPLAAGLFPAITAAILAAFAAGVTIQAVLGLRRASRDGPAVSGAPAVAGNPPGLVVAYATVFGLCVVLAFLILSAGHLIGTFVFLAASLLLIGAQRRGMALLVAGVATLVVAGVFDGLVSQPWPRPWLAWLADSLPL
jgi:hypothetical protein